MVDTGGDGGGGGGDKISRVDKDFTDLGFAVRDAPFGDGGVEIFTSTNDFFLGLAANFSTGDFSFCF